MTSVSLIDIASEAAWRRDYPAGGSMYQTYESTPFHDKEVYRKEVAPIVAAFADWLRNVPVEVVAQALCVQEGVDPDEMNHERGYFGWHDYVSQADAAIAALIALAEASDQKHQE